MSTYSFPEFRYLNAAASLNLEQDANGALRIQTDKPDPYRLNDLHSQSGCLDHTRSGCSNHYDSYHGDHSDTWDYCYDYYYYRYYDDYHYQVIPQHDKYYYYFGGEKCKHYYIPNVDPDYWATYDNCSVHPYYACKHGYVDTCECVDYTVHKDQSYTSDDYYCHDYRTRKYEQSYCSDHYDEGCDDCYDYGYSNHRNYGYNNHTNYTNNFAPKISGVVTPSSGTFNQSISIAWPAATDKQAPGQSVQTIYYELKYRYKAIGASSFGAWQMLLSKAAKHTATSYLWNTRSLPAGTYKVSVVAWDGLEYSTTTLVSNELIVSHYQAPSWSTVIKDSDAVFRKKDMDEVRTEVNTARTAFGLPKASFTDPTITAQFTIIKTEHITELRPAVLEARQAAGRGSTFGWTHASLSKNASEIKGIDLKEIRNNLDDISG